jgi:hypothetical protein
MKTSVEHTLALLRNHRLETAYQPHLERIYAPRGAVHLGARPRAPAWPRAALWVVLGLGALLCLFLIAGGRKEAPTITIVTPSHESTVPAGDVPLSVRVTGARPTESSAPGRYHLHYYLDVSPPTAAGKPAITAGSSWSSTVATSYTWKSVAAGTHVLSVQLVRGDNTPLDPAVTDSVTVRVVSPSPEPASLPSSTPPRPPSRGS